MVGLGRFELPTSRLSGVRSNQLSYRPSTRAGSRRARTLPGSRESRGPLPGSAPGASGNIEADRLRGMETRARAPRVRSGAIPARDPGSLLRSLKTK